MAKYGARSEAELLSGWLRELEGGHARKREGLRQQVGLWGGWGRGRSGALR